MPRNETNNSSRTPIRILGLACRLGRCGRAPESLGMAAIVENEAFTSDVVSADLKAKLNGKWCICHQEGLDGFYRDARHLGWLQRKVLCVTTGVSVEFEFGADNTCKFTMTFSLKSATGDFTLGTPIKDDEHNVTTLLRARGDTITVSYTHLTLPTIYSV